MSYRQELIQAAAVAVAAVECHDCGAASSGAYTDTVLQEVFEERRRQDKKWGVQSHAPDRWLTILHEETGEVARAILEGG